MSKIVYTHDTGVSIEVGRVVQQVRTGKTVLGPFEPFDVEETMHAIGAHVRQTEQVSLLQAAMDWQRINPDESPLEDQDGKSVREEKWVCSKWVGRDTPCGCPRAGARPTPTTHFECTQEKYRWKWATGEDESRDAYLSHLPYEGCHKAACGFWPKTDGPVTGEN